MHSAGERDSFQIDKPTEKTQNAKNHLGRVTPNGRSQSVVQVFGKSFSETICERLAQNGMIVVAVFCVLLAQLIDSKSSRAGERSNIVRHTRILWCNKVGKAIIRFCVFFLRCEPTAISEPTTTLLFFLFTLLPQTVKSSNDFLAIFTAVDLDVVA
jgi:hypothetical protein